MTSICILYVYISVRSRAPRLSAQIHSPYEYNTESTRSSYFSRACLTEYKIRYSVTYIVAATSIQLAKVTVDVFLVIIRVLAPSVELMSPTRSFVSSLRRFKGTTLWGYFVYLCSSCDISWYRTSTIQRGFTKLCRFAAVSTAHVGSYGFFRAAQFSGLCITHTYSHCLCSTTVESGLKLVSYVITSLCTIRNSKLLCFPSAMTIYLKEARESDICIMVFRSMLRPYKQ
ncbi:uncharacterized protein LOC126925093 isoform X1 [Bombus affinis]|uniref:Uncharacterized protein LOC125385563 isoform X1 n=1 Tax=Bombus terrestris TaxID=30195 RepID=A0A9C6SCL2_BOMTE|nr:uncharacterized protein LOC125385563 isoform X1 [Bombus terrestris]XP_050596227.1 uncharacterized protein LOC126925093 isoform X1 [Bombus affinis]